MAHASVDRPKARTDSARGTAAARGGKADRAAPAHRARIHLSGAPAFRLSGVVQRKVVIGQPGDRFEQEADSVADGVVGGTPIPQISRLSIGGLRPAQRQPEENADDEEPAQEMSIQRQEEEEPSIHEAAVQRQMDDAEEDAEEPVSPKRGGTAAVTAGMSSAAANAIQSRGAGSPLRPGVRSTLEGRLGADLTGVRVHQDANARQANRTLQSRAFAHGNNIWLGAGESPDDLRLIAHETTHVLQQDGVVRRKPLDEDDEETSTPVEGSAGEATSATSAGGAASSASGPTVEGPEPQETQTPAAEESTAETETREGEETEAGAPPAGEPTPAAEEPEAAPAAGAGAGAGVEILMPEPPSELTPAAQARLNRAQRRAGEASGQVRELPAADQNVEEARAAVEEPEEEVAGRARTQLAASLDERPAPSPEIEELCKRIAQVIHDKRPPDEDSLVKAEPREMAREAGGELNQSIEGDVDRVEGSYNELDKPPEGERQQEPQDMQPPPARVETAPLGAQGAVNDQVPEEDVSLEADVEQNQQRLEETGMAGREHVDMITQPGNPVVDAREGQAGLEETAARGPAEVLREQEALHQQASADMAGLQQRALEALQSSRESTVGQTVGQQTSMVGSEQQMRAEISRKAQTIFNEARDAVTALLNPLTQNAMNKWETGREILATEFKQDLKRVEDLIEERHSGVGGAFVSVWDDITGLPDWVTHDYDRAEKNFADGVCELIREISAEVNLVIATCEAIIAGARQRLTDLYTKDLPDSLKQWAQEQLGDFNKKLDGLSERVANTRDGFNRDLANRAAQAVQDVRQQIHELREAAKGLIGKIADAISAFIEDPIKFIIEGLLQLVGIPPASFWALVDKIGDAISAIADDPLGFAGNLLKALGKGFEQFFDRIGKHLLNGLLEWLFSGLGSVGVAIPSDFSLKSVITFVLQLMGISWARIRMLLVKHIGEQNVALIEKAFEIISTLVEKGPEGLFEMIKEQLDPQMILQMILDAAVDFLIDALIKAVTPRIIALFTPVGAIAQAIEAIYRVLKWIFENAARIFSLIETVVDGILDIVAGNISGMANAVETALAKLIPPVIDFLAGFVGLGDLPEKIAETIKGFQDWIFGILDRVIGWLAEKAKALLAKLGIGKKDEEGSGDYDGEIGKTVRFTAAGESHRLFVAVRGKDTVVMMASAERPLSEQLDEYERMAGDLQEKKRDEVLAMIGQARAKLNDVDQQADDLAKQVSNPERDQAKVDAQDDSVEGGEQSLAQRVSQIREALGIDDFGTQENPIPLDWPKRASAAYPTLYFGPRSKKPIAQSVLAQGDKTVIGGNLTAKEKRRWDDAGQPLEAFAPHDRKDLPMGGRTIGITGPWQIHVGKTFQFDPKRTMGGGLINRTLAPWGYRARAAGMDGDHILEMQMGGENVVENLWPLDKSENRSSGSILSSKTFTKPDGDRISMPELKQEAKSRSIWFTITKTL